MSKDIWHLSERRDNELIRAEMDRVQKACRTIDIEATGPSSSMYRTMKSISRDVHKSASRYYAYEEMNDHASNDENENSSEMDEDDSRKMLQQSKDIAGDLRRWIFKESMPQNAVNKLLHILREYGHKSELPQDARTLMRTSKSTVHRIEEINGGLHANLGTVDGIQKALQSHSVEYPESNYIQLNSNGGTGLANPSLLQGGNLRNERFLTNHLKTKSSTLGTRYIPGTSDVRQLQYCRYGKIDYAVVTFVEEQITNEVPTNWLVFEGKDRTRCWWPPAYVSDLTSLIVKRKKPNKESWKLHVVTVQKFFGDVDKARKYAEDCTYCRTGSVKREKCFRKRNSDTIYADDSTENEYTDAPVAHKIPKTLPERPNNEWQVEFLDTNYLEREEESTLQYSIHTSPEPSTSDGSATMSKTLVQANLDEKPEVDSRPTIQSASVETSLHDVYKKLEKLEGLMEECSNKLNTVMRGITTQNVKLTALEQIVDRLVGGEIRKSLSYSSTKRVQSVLPINSFDGLRAVEELLTNDEFVTEYKCFISKIGGHTDKDYVQRALRRIFSNQFAINCSWKGRRQKFRIENSPTIQILKEALVDGQTSLTHRVFEQIGAGWFRFAKQRASREKQ